MSAVAGADDPFERLLDRVLDGYTGVLKFVSIADLQADEPPLFVGMAEMLDSRKLEPRRLSTRDWQRKSRLVVRDTSAHLRAPSGTIHASGAGLSREAALWATVGEALERYAMGYYHPTDTVFAAAAELQGLHVDPSELILFNDEQYASADFPFARYDPSQRRHWLTGISLISGQPSFLPAELCIGFPIAGGAPRLDGAYSTGCAAGQNYDHALLSGLSEVVERDAFMYYWLTERQPPALDGARLMPTLPEALQELLRFPHVDIFLRWLKTDIDIPTVVCFIKPRYARGIATGASTHVNWRLAVEKAVVEAFHTLNWTVDLDRWQRKPLSREDIRDFPQHVSFYLDEQNHPLLEFLISEGGPDGTSEFQARFEGRPHTLAEAARQVSRLGYEPLAVDRTYDDMDSIGIKIVHVVVPGLQPLHVGLGIEHRDMRRLQAISRHLKLPLPQRLNLNPHPFP